MLPEPEDFLDAVEAQLEAAREAAALAVDRATALAELRSLALAAHHRLQRPLHGPDDLVWPADDEERRAAVRALVARAVRP